MYKTISQVGYDYYILQLILNHSFGTSMVDPRCLITFCYGTKKCRYLNKFESLLCILFFFFLLFMVLSV